MADSHNAMFYKHFRGFRIQNDTFQVTLNEEEAKAIIRDVLKFMGAKTRTTAGQEYVLIPAGSIEWLNLEEGS